RGRGARRRAGRTEHGRGGRDRGCGAAAGRRIPVRTVMRRSFARSMSVVVVALAGAACRGGAMERPAADAPEPARKGHVGAVTRAAGGRIAVPGRLAARDTATLSARIPASVLQLPFREGERVAKGDVVVRLDDAALHAADAAAQAASSAVESDLARIRTLV